MAVAHGSKLVRHQAIRLKRAPYGRQRFVVKAWHQAGDRKRWVTIGYLDTRQAAEAFAAEQAFQQHGGDGSVAIFYGHRKLKQWKGTVKITCPACHWSGGVPLERTAGGGL